MIFTTMKMLIRNCSLLLVGLFAAGVLTTAEAQRGGFRGVSGRSFGKSYSYHPGVYNNYHSPVYNSVHQPLYYPYRPPVVYHGHSPIFFGPRYYAPPAGSISITFGGNPYYYNSGV